VYSLPGVSKVYGFVLFRLIVWLTRLPFADAGWVDDEMT
jgi:hypothetical protein